MAKSDPFDALSKTTDRAKLSSQKNLVLLAYLSQKDPERYETMLAFWREQKVPRLRELEAQVKRTLKREEALSKDKVRAPADDRFERDKKSGAVLPTQSNIRFALEELGVSIRYNEFAGIFMIDGLDDFGPQLNDPALNRLWLTVDASFGFHPRLEFFKTVVEDTGYRNRFHPVRDFLDGLEWDRTPRLDSWLIDYCGVKDTAYARAVGRIVLVAAARRVRQPGCKFDEMLVLESPEGFNKSSLLQALAGPDDWFTDSLPLNVDDKKMIENSRGKWIVEVAELQGMRKHDVGILKAQLSRRSDRGRMAYDRMTSEVPRQFICVGTVNPAEEEGYLASLTGNRRFWPVEVQRIDLAAFKADRDQLWAEAAAREAKGESIRLDSKLWNAAGLEQRKREAPNPLYDLLLPSLGNAEGTIFAVDVWKLLNIPVERRQQQSGKFGAAMKRLGFTKRERRRVRGGKKEGAYHRGEEGVLLTVELDPFDKRPSLKPVESELPTEATEVTEDG